MDTLDVHRVAFSYGKMSVLREVSFGLSEGEVVSLLGPNGSGKSTLLKLALGLLSPASGAVTLRGRSLSRIAPRELARELAYVPQLHRDAFPYSVGEVVLMGRMPHLPFLASYGESDRRAAWEALERVGISHLAGRAYTEVSGGERQLSLIARAMAQGARILVMDEPTNGLDYGNQVRFLDRMLRLSREGFACLFSTHHPEQALAVADRVLMLRHGLVLAEGPPSQIINRSNIVELYGVAPRWGILGGGEIPSRRTPLTREV